MRDSTSQLDLETAILDDVSTAHISTPHAEHCALPGLIDDQQERCGVVPFPTFVAACYSIPCDGTKPGGSCSHRDVPSLRASQSFPPRLNIVRVRPGEAFSGRVLWV